MSMEQQKIWKKHASNISVSDIIRDYYKPYVFQKELASLINNICEENKYTRVIEVGCESGITSMLLEKSLEKYFLDLNNEVLQKVEQACRQLKIKGKFISEDMFSMNCPDGFYDVVFNSGVIEHFNKMERIDILREYSRVLKRDGIMILAIPNHYSFPYRSAYLFKKKILRGFQWPWPDEFKIYDLETELGAAKLQLVKRTTFAKEAIFSAWSFLWPIKKLLIWSDFLFNYEGYLTVLVIKKRYQG